MRSAIKVKSDASDQNDSQNSVLCNSRNTTSSHSFSKTLKMGKAFFFILLQSRANIDLYKHIGGSFCFLF